MAADHKPDRAVSTGNPMECIRRSRNECYITLKLIDPIMIHSS
jgi:hypothetical protein